jgi:hypothetical protein
MKRCLNIKHFHGGTGRLLHKDECVECIAEERDLGVIRISQLEAVLRKILEAHEMNSVDWSAMRKARELLKG